MFRYPLHKEWLRQAVLSRTIVGIRIEEYATDQDKFEAVGFKPRGWGWIQPRTDVPAMIEAANAGFMPIGDVIAATCNGKDFWDVMKEIQHERKLMAELELEFTTSPSVFVPEEKATPVTTPTDGKSEDDPPEPENKDDDSTEKPANQRVFPFRR
jgi:capsid protein